MKPKIDEKMMMETAGSVKNWGKWGSQDEVGTVNYVSADDIVRASSLVKKGVVFALGMNFDSAGPQKGFQGRNNPIHSMIWTGPDVVTGRHLAYLEKPSGRTGAKWYDVNFADDNIMLSTHCATHWASLAHIFFRDLYNDEYYMYNGYSPKYVDAVGGCTKSGIDKFKGKMVGRGVLLDMARFYGKEFMEPGMGIPPEDLSACAKKENVNIQKGDFLLIRTGDLDRRIKEKDWGTYCGGDAPGLEYETVFWLHDKEVAAVSTDTWGAEVRPNRSDLFEQPWHWVAIPMAGLSVGENFRLDALADDCAADGQYEFLFVAPPLAITNATASPINPIVIK
jgi:kynurenine formamidase